jgi:hypothetical protein
MENRKEMEFLPPLEMSAEEKELVSLAYGRLLRWENDCREYHAAAKAARATLMLKDPDQDGNGQYKTLQLQSLLSTFKNAVADQMDNMPEARMLPERPGLEKVAEDLTDVVAYVFSQNDYDSALHRQLVEDYIGVGTAIAQVSYDQDMADGEGDIAVIRWPIESFVWDCSAADVQEARALMKLSWHPLEWFKAHYPERGAYVGGDSSHENMARPASQEGIDDEEGSALLLEYWWREYDAKKRKYKVNVAYLAGNVLLEKFENVYAHGMYPFVVAAFNRIPGQMIGMGMTDELRPMMQYVNRYARYIDENLRMSAKIRMLVNQNAGINEQELEDWECNVIHGDRIGEDGVRWLQSKPLNGIAVQQMLQYQTDIKQDSGQNQFTRGETAGGVTAASAISALQEAGGKISRMHTAALNSLFKNVVVQVIWLINEFYDDKRVKLITGTGGERHAVDMNASYLMGEEVLPEEVQAQLAQLPQEEQMKILSGARAKRRKRRTKGVLPAPPYTVQIQVQRRNPLRVQAQNELFIQAYTMAAQAGQQFPLVLLFEMLNVDGKERILPILQQVDQQTQMLQQLQAENERLVQSEANLKQVVMEQNKALAGEVGQSAQAQSIAEEQQVDPEIAMGAGV